MTGFETKRKEFRGGECSKASKTTLSALPNCMAKLLDACNHKKTGEGVKAELTLTAFRSPRGSYVQIRLISAPCV